jgi:hypothetical protein
MNHGKFRWSYIHERPRRLLHRLYVPYTHRLTHSLSLSLLLLVCIIKVLHKLKDVPTLACGPFMFFHLYGAGKPAAAQVGNLGIASAAQGDLQTSRICLQRPRGQSFMGQPRILLVSTGTSRISAKRPCFCLFGEVMPEICPVWLVKPPFYSIFDG